MGALAIRLISLLRTQLKSDLAIYGPTYSGELHKYERFFLEHSKVNLWPKAWATTAGPDYRWWQRLPLLRATDKSLKVKPQASSKPGLPQPSPLRGMSPVLSVGKIPQTPQSSRAALAKALSRSSIGSAQD
jgi:hypothetical protein